MERGTCWRAKRRRANRQNPMGQSEYPEAESVSRPSDRFVEEDGDEEAESLILHCIFNSFLQRFQMGLSSALLSPSMLEDITSG